MKIVLKTKKNVLRRRERVTFLPFLTHLHPYANGIQQFRFRETARRVCVAFAPHLPPVCRYHAHAFGVDRARVAFAVASLAGGGISLDARPAPFSCAPAMLTLLDEGGGERVAR